MKLDDYTLKYFDLGNAITGFAVVQMIAFLIALGAKEGLAEKILISPGWRITIAAMSVGTLLYLAAVIGCGCVEAKLFPAAKSLVIRTTAGRVTAIVAISGFGFFTLWKICDQVSC